MIKTGRKNSYQTIQKATSKYLSSTLPVQNQNLCNTSELNEGTKNIVTAAHFTTHVS